MRPFRLRDPMDVKAADVSRIMEICLINGVRCTGNDAIVLWRNHSTMNGCVWMTPPKNPDELWGIVRRYLDS